MKKFLSILLALAMLPCIAFASGTESVGYDISIAADNKITIDVKGTALANDHVLVSVIDSQDATKNDTNTSLVENAAFDNAVKVKIKNAMPNGVKLTNLNIDTYRKHFGFAQANSEGKYSVSFDFIPDATVDKAFLLIGPGGSFDEDYEATILYIPSVATITEAMNAINAGITKEKLEEYDYVFGINTASSAYSRVSDKIAAAVSVQKGNTSYSTFTDAVNTASFKYQYNTALAYYTRQLEALDKINSPSTTPNVLYNILTSEYPDVIGDFGYALTSADINNKYTTYSPYTVNMLLVGKTYASMENFKADFLNATPESTTPSTPGTPSNPTGDGGGGGGGGGGAMTVPLAPGTQAAGPLEMFSDLASVPWAKASIENLAKREVINGMGDGTFNPNGFVTREQFVKMLILSFGGDVLNLKTKFADVDPTQWYAVYVNTANEKGIVNGVSDTKFGVGSPITRQDLVTMLSRACETYGVTLTQNANVSFTDSYTIADYAYNAVMQMAGAGIVNGVSDGIFAPGEYATRAQVAVILDRLNSYQ